MLEIDEKAMAYCLVEALFAAGVILSLIHI